MPVNSHDMLCTDALCLYIHVYNDGHVIQLLTIVDDIPGATEIESRDGIAKAPPTLTAYHRM